jgi:hypothetical protein
MNINHPIQRMLCFLILAFVLSALAACGFRPMRIKGETVPAERRIPFKEGGPHESVWTTNDLSLVYRYTKNQNALRLDCELKLNKKKYRGFAIVNHIFFRVNFIDIVGRIIKTKVVWNPGFTMDVWNWTFESDLDIPPKATGMVFSYEGSLRESQGGGVDTGAIVKDFWKSPLEPPPELPSF